MSAPQKNAIVLATLNARYHHPAFGLRYLLANLGPLRECAAILEFDIRQRPADIAERILAREPAVVGLGVYVWNAVQSAELVAILKRVRPGARVVIGGPEVSYETAEQEIAALADHVICGEADLEFARLCADLLSGKEPATKIIAAPPPDLRELVFPYDLYGPEDIAHRTLYVEASRGCPFACEFCLSSLDGGVRRFDTGAFLAEMERLLARGASHFKFVDRTFNLHPETSRIILEFFLARYRPGMFLHFEIVPDRLPDDLFGVAARFPVGSVQFEVGVQTFDAAVGERIGRRQDPIMVERNLRRLRAETGVHVHADLIFGLPGEGLEGFGAGFDRLCATDPHEIQVGVLKRLRGAPIARHDAAWDMVYSPVPPYEILRNRSLDFADVQRMKRFARYWDLVANSGNFRSCSRLLCEAGRSAFREFLGFSDWMFGCLGRIDSIALHALAEKLCRYLTGEKGMDSSSVMECLARDYAAAGRGELPEFMADKEGRRKLRKNPGLSRGLPKRQARREI